MIRAIFTGLAGFIVAVLAYAYLIIINHQTPSYFAIGIVLCITAFCFYAGLEPKANMARRYPGGAE